MKIKNILFFILFTILISMCLVSCDIDISLNTNNHTHTTVIDEAIEPTCLATGLTAGAHCSECDKVLVEQQEIPMKDHTEGNWIIDKKATELEEGRKHQICSVCGTTIKETVISSFDTLDYKVNYDGTTCTIIGIGTFKGTELHIPEFIDGYKVTAIGSYAFYGCNTIKSVIIPDGTTNIGASAFSYCGTLSSVAIPDSITNIDKYAFNNCISLTSITVPGNIMTIGEHAFSNCYKLVEVINNSRMNIVIGSSDLGNIGLYAKEVHRGTSKIINSDEFLFYSYKGLNYLLGYVGDDTYIQLPEKYNNKNYEIYAYAFYERNDIEAITIPQGVSAIGSYAFYRCHSIKSIVIPDSITSIGQSAFSQCSSLASVNIPNGITTIESNVFSSCIALTSITIPNSIVSIENYAFSGCQKLVEVINHSDLNIVIGADDMGGVGCYAREIHTGSSKIINNNDFLFYTYNGTHFLMGYVGKDTDLVLPTNYNGELYTIYKCAFYNCRNITSIVLPDGITSIRSDAFTGCSNLKTINIPDSVTSIGEYAFGGCSSLEKIIIPNSVTTIKPYAFRYCSSLSSVILGEGITEINGSVFANCTNITFLFIPKSITSISIEAFYGTTGNMTIYYAGTPEEWNNISFSNPNNYSNGFTNALKYYYSETKPTDTTNKYWRYVGNMIMVWS